LKCLNGLLILFTSQKGEADHVSGKFDFRGGGEEIYEALVLSDSPVVLTSLKVLFGEPQLALRIQHYFLTGIYRDTKEGKKEKYQQPYRFFVEATGPTIPRAAGANP